MVIAFNEENISGRHTISYRIRDSHRGYPERTVEVWASPEEIERFVTDGYLVRESLLPDGEIRRLRDALGEV